MLYLELGLGCVYTSPKCSVTSIKCKRNDTHEDRSWNHWLVFSSVKSNIMKDIFFKIIKLRKKKIMPMILLNFECSNYLDMALGFFKYRIT